MIIDLLKSIENSMSLLNEQITPEIESQMDEEQRKILDDVRKTSSKEELKKHAEKLSKLSERFRNN